MNVIAIIPARMGSSRFPGKPLADIHGLPMVGHVALRTRMAKSVSATYVATCDPEIRDAMEALGLPAVMTKDTHERCSDRTAEAMLKIEAETGRKVDVVVMVQGDEPMVTPAMIDLALKPLLEEPETKVVNLYAAMKSRQEFEDPNEVKVVVSPDQRALYFSREPIPSNKKWNGPIPMFKQVCIIPFRRDALLEFNAMSETELERIESVDMLRILEHGGAVRMVRCDEPTYSVDTPADLAHVIGLMRGDPLLPSYKR